MGPAQLKRLFPNQNQFELSEAKFEFEMHFHFLNFKRVCCQHHQRNIPIQMCVTENSRH